MAEPTANLVEAVQACLGHDGAATLAVVDAESDLARGLAGYGVALCSADRPDRRDDLWPVDA